MESAYLGIDPGLQGALAIVSLNIKVLETIKIPTIKLEKKSTYDIQRFYSILKELNLKYHLKVIVEKAHAMPLQGVTSMFTTGYGFGLILGIVTALEIPYEVVTAPRWKKDLLAGLPKGKEASILAVSRLFPEVYNSSIINKKDHNITDAILIAEWARRRDSHI